MRTEKREVSIADDGKVFETEAACIAHEQKIAAMARRVENLKVHVVRSSFDATEGRGFHRTTYIVTDQSMPVVLEYCFDRFGKPLSAWYGDGFYEAWLLNSTEMTAADAIRRAKEPHGGIALSSGEADIVFLSQSDIDHPGLPKRVFPWPKRPEAKK